MEGVWGDDVKEAVAGKMTNQCAIIISTDDSG